MILLTGLAFALLSATPTHADSVTERDIRSAYLAAVHVDVTASGRDTLISLRVASPPDGLLSAFLSDHKDWLTYLVKNGRQFRVRMLDYPASKSERADYVREAVVVEGELRRQLVEDSQFDAIVVSAIGGYLRQHGTLVSLGVRLPEPRLVSMDTAMNVAVRFFDPDNISADNRILTHVCVELNAVRELPNRNVALEALIFSAINRDQNSEVTRVEAEYGPARQLMHELDVASAPREARLRRAQGVVWASMRSSQVLRSLLLEEAARSREISGLELNSR